MLTQTNIIPYPVSNDTSVAKSPPHDRMDELVKQMENLTLLLAQDRCNLLQRGRTSNNRARGDAALPSLEESERLRADAGVVSTSRA